MKKFLGHPLTQKTRTVVRRVVITAAVILAAAFVTTVTVDLGPVLRERAEKAGSDFMKRPMHIGRLSVRLWLGRYVVDDLRIDGLTPEARPFLTARQLTVSMPWSTLFNRRIVFDAVEMTDWLMYVETFPDGTHNFPKVTRDTPRDPNAWTTTLQYVRAHRGEFAYQDHGTPWGVVTRNLDVIITRPTSEYRGQASFSNGTVTFQDYVPFRIDMASTFNVDGGFVRFDKIDLQSEGADTELVGAVDIGRWPEMTYQLTSKIDFPTQKAIWFARDKFTVTGTGDFTGTLHMFKETLPNGRTRTGRELTGTFHSPEAGVDDYRFGDLRGSVLWVPERLEITDATAGVYGGTGRFDYRMGPLGQKDVRATATFDASYENVDLTEFSNFLELDGIRLAGRATGSNVLVWPLGRFAERQGDGEIRIEPPPGVATMTRGPVVSLEEELRRAEAVPFSNHTPRTPVPIRADLVYALDPEWIDIAPSRIATPSSYVEFQGRTAYGDRSRIEFHVTSGDWQDSDREFAGFLTAVGSRTNAIPIGGYGTFDGVMLNSVRRPRIEGEFAGERMRAFDVVWGSVTGRAVIENNYVDVTDGVVGSGDSVMHVDGRFSLGYPRRDGGEEINARIRIIRRPLTDLRHAFELDDYDMDGLFSGEFHVFGNYLTPYGFGQMAIVEGVAYGEPFETATAAVRLEGTGIRLDSLQMVKGGGRATGAAYVGLNGTYSFNLDGRRIPVERIALVTSEAAPPLAGMLDFTAGGSGTFDDPRYDVRGTISDLFVGDEGIGQVIGELTLYGELLTIKLEAASPRLAVSGSGRIVMNPQMDAELSFSVADTSLDPYLRAFNPRLSPFTTAIASGNIRVVGQLANIDELLVETTVDRLDLRLFDYRLRNSAPIRMALDRHSVRISEMRLVGEDTQLDISGLVNLHDERINVRATGDAGLGILQGFVSNIRSSGRASLEATFEGPMLDPLVTGTMRIENGRIRHFALPHALENISGPVRFDSRSIRLDEVTAQLGQGPVRFGGRIDIERYEPTRVDVTMSGENMRLRFPEGMRSLVDADLTLQGTVDAPVLAGSVFVRNAVYTRQFDAGGGVFNFTGAPAGLPGDSAPLASTLALRYDVQITAPSTLEIRNSSGQVVATADVQLRGTFERPLLFGRAEVERGQFTFEGRRYQITRGTIDFNNPTRIDPFFDIETETRVRVPGQTYRVIARAAGTMDRLTPTFEADPPLQEVEVLSLLLSDVAPGQDVEFSQYTSITPQQQLLRDRATRALTGTVTSQVGRVVEQTFGVDTFQLTPSLVDPNTQSSRLDPAARLTIGKRLSERMYLTYSRSLSSSTRDQIILLEYDQTDRFSWILSRNEDRTYALDVRVRRSF